MKVTNTAHLKRLAEFLDTQFAGPFGLRIGWDGILSLFPGIGPAITTALSGIVILQGIQLGAPLSVVARMILNVLIDNGIGSIPLFGWIGDFFWKSNTRNVAILEAYLVSPAPVTRDSKIFIGVLAILSLITIIGLVLAAGLAIYGFIFMLTR